MRFTQKRILPESARAFLIYALVLLPGRSLFAQTQESLNGASVDSSTTVNAAKKTQANPVKTDSVIEGENRDYFNLSKYQPTYFAYGNPTSKVQFSFKYRLVRDFPLYGAYTQTMFWAMRQESMPFKDVNFSPEFFYRWSLDSKYLESVDFIPYWHKSNGKDGHDSRSVDSTGVRLNGKYQLNTTMFRWSVKVYKFYDADNETPDFYEWYGPYEVTLSYLQFFRYTIDRAELSFHFYGGGRWGQALSKGGQEVTLSFRVFGFDITPSFYFSVFHGYGESLLKYNQKDTNFRGGILF